MSDGNATGDAEPRPCRHCGTATTQRAVGIPYCSMDCLGARRRELERETIECPYPDCDWSADYDPDNSLSRAIANNDVEDHREEHRSQLAETTRDGGDGR